MSPTLLRLSERAHLRHTCHRSFVLASGYFPTRWAWYCWRRRGKGIDGLPKEE